jgi:hypothetical protein
MNKTSIIVAMALFTATAFPVHADWRDAPVSVDTTGLLPNLAAQVEKHAAEGIVKLSRYLVRTRKYHNLVVEDVMKEPVAPTPVETAFLDRELKRHAHQWKRVRN